MKSIKRTVFIIMSFVMTLILSSIFLNFFYINSLLEDFPFISNLHNFIILSLFIIIFLLSGIIIKIIAKDIPYMKKGFELLSKHDYNTDSLTDMKPLFKEEKEIQNTVSQVFKEHKFLDDVKRITGSGYILDEILESLFFHIRNVMRTDRIGVAFIDSATQKIVAEHGVISYGSILLGPGFEVPIDQTSLSELIKSKKPRIMNDIDFELKQRPNSPSLRLIKEEGINSNMIVPLIIEDGVFGFIFFSSIHKNNYDKSSLNLAVSIAREIAIVIDKSYLTKKMFATVTRSFADLVEKKDTETGDHLDRMTEYSRIITEGLLNHKDPDYKVSRAFVNKIRNNAAVHDIGKIGVPDEILKKPGKLTDEEWKIMKLHPNMGAEVLINLKNDLKIFNRDFYSTAVEIANCHHEKWDGSGYPNGLKGKEIPLSARIIALADVFDALTSKRAYKKDFGFDESLDIIRDGSGSHFDPLLVEVFMKKLPEIKKIYSRGSYTKAPVDEMKLQNSNI